MVKLRAGIAASCLVGALASPVSAHADGPAPASADTAIGAITNLLKPKIFTTSSDPADIGQFGSPFTEPTLNGKVTDAKCEDGAGPAGLTLCKPAAGSLSQLPNGRVVYWDALGGTENVKFTIVGEYGAVALNDEARVLDLTGGDGAPKWSVPTPKDGGANPNGERDPKGPLIPGGETTEPFNDGAMFGSTGTFLPDGRELVTGGTDYSLDPGVNGSPLGVAELSGLRNARIFDPGTDRFTQTGSTELGRWYPTNVTLGDGDVLTIGGVRKLLKPVYLDKPGDSLANVKPIERYDTRAGTWSGEGRAAERDLPLYPRVHLLPDGNVFFNAAGQAFNPFGQSVGEAGWMNAAYYNTRSHNWTNLGIPGLGAEPLTFGFRGSTSSTMLPLEPDADGRYTKASFLTAGGVLLPSPGSYVAVRDSRISTVDTTPGRKVRMTTEATGPFNQPRWFSQSILLPTGEVVAFSGADRDEVVLPGLEFPVQQAELFNPATKKWRPIAVAHHPRTYHNTAVLRPDGEVLVGGHATISTGYLNNTTLPGGFAPHDGRDPSFELFKPPYLFRGPRPTIKRTKGTLTPGSTFGVRLGKGEKADDIESVRISRNSAVTHLVDADQRQVVLPVTGRKHDARNGDLLLVKAPPNGNVAPPGPYMLFVNKKSDKGPIPSVAKQVTVATTSGT